MRRSLKWRKIHQTPYFRGSVIDVTTPGKRIMSACYVKQQACVYLQPFSR